MVTPVPESASWSSRRTSSTDGCPSHWCAALIPDMSCMPDSVKELFTYNPDERLPSFGKSMRLHRPIW